VNGSLTTLWRFGGIATLALLMSCGGVGTDGTGARTDSISIGVVTGIEDSSVTVGGLAYERGSASVTDGFGRSINAEDLRLGMWLEVLGTVNQADGRATAQSIRVKPAARGAVSAVDGGGLSLDVLQSTVRYNNQATVVEGVEAASGLKPGDIVEVHGPLGAADGAVELRGRVRSLDLLARRLIVGNQPVRYDLAEVTLPEGLLNRQVVRVSSVASPVLGQAWLVERLKGDQPLPDSLDFIYVEGVTTDWARGPTFRLDGLFVDATFANRGSVVTGNGLRVSVIGSLSRGRVEAKSVTLSEPGKPLEFVLNSPVTDFKSIASFRVRGVEVDASRAAFEGGLATDVADKRRVRVTGTLDGRKLIAARVQVL
jgi:hypothetical protein